MLPNSGKTMGILPPHFPPSLAASSCHEMIKKAVVKNGSENHWKFT
jgi:hypothetical protein